jgi:hypothetical protein
MAVRLDVADGIPVRVLAGARPAGLDGHVAVGQRAVQQPVGAHHARVADVEDVGVLVVQPKPKADQGERQRDQDQRVVGADVGVAGPVREADAEHPGQQVDERRVDERRRPEQVSAHEPDQRDAE